MRLIDADAFKDYIREACEDLAPLFNDNGKVARLVTESFCKDIDEQPTIQPEPHWIPCSERLPEQYGNYLVSIEGEEPDIGTINPNDPRGWSLCDANGFYWASDKMLNVIAWMPLPEPYKEGQE